MDDRSFVRFGGLAAILLALTSWAAVLAYAAFVEPGDARLGLQIVHFLYALIAFWALFAIVAVYYRMRSVGEAWAFFAMLVGIVSGTYSTVFIAAAIAILLSTRSQVNAIRARALHSSEPGGY